MLFIMFNPQGLKRHLSLVFNEQQRSLEIKQHLMNVILGPFASIKTSEHPSGWILFRTVFRVSFLTSEEVFASSVDRLVAASTRLDKETDNH